VSRSVPSVHPDRGGTDGAGRGPRAGPSAGTVVARRAVLFADRGWRNLTQRDLGPRVVLSGRPNAFSADAMKSHLSVVGEARRGVGFFFRQEGVLGRRRPREHRTIGVGPPAFRRSKPWGLRHQVRNAPGPVRARRVSDRAPLRQQAVSDQLAGRDNRSDGQCKTGRGSPPTASLAHGRFAPRGAIAIPPPRTPPPFFLIAPTACDQKKTVFAEVTKTFRFKFLVQPHFSIKNSRAMHAHLVVSGPAPHISGVPPCPAMSIGQALSADSDLFGKSFGPIAQVAKGTVSLRPAVSWRGNRLERSRTCYTEYESGVTYWSPNKIKVTLRYSRRQRPAIGSMLSPIQMQTYLLSSLWRENHLLA